MSEYNFNGKLQNSSDKVDWMNKHWRPAMAYQYMIICLFDFMVAPVLLGAFAIITKTPLVMWTPLTMASGGFYHLAMGAVVGVSAWTRGQENIATITSPKVEKKDE